MLNTLFQVSVLTPGGVSYNLNDLYLFISQQADGFGMPPLHRIAERGPMQHGETDLGFRLDPRELVIAVQGRALSPTAFYSLRAQLLDIFRPNTSPLALVFTSPAGTSYYLDCFLVKGLSFPAPGGSAGKKVARSLSQDDKIILRAPDPTFYNPTQQVVNVNLYNFVGFKVPTDVTTPIGTTGFINTVLYLNYLGS